MASDSGTVVGILLIALPFILFAASKRRKEFRVEVREQQARERAAGAPGLTLWRGVCFLLALPLVYAFEQQLYEAIALIVHGTALAVPAGFNAFMEALTRLFPKQISSLLGILVGIVFAVVALVIALVLGVIMVIVMAVLAIPWVITYWLVTNPGPPRYVLDLAFVWYVGLFLYGVFFPLLWRAIEPVIAMTLGEIAFERARSRVYGVRPRYSEPLYLVVAVVGLGISAVRFLAPVAGSAGAAAGEAWTENISAVWYTPTPNPWPKKFTVAANSRLATGIYLPTTDTEVGLRTTRLARARVGNAEVYLWKSNESAQRYGCVAPAGRGEAERCWAVIWSFAQPGELYLFGGDESATVEVFAPASSDRKWFAPGITQRVERWVAEGDTFWYCGTGSLQYRTVSAAGKGRWRDLGNRDDCRVGPGSIGQAILSPVDLQGNGFIEVTSNKYLSWFTFLRIDPGRRRVHVRAGQSVDTKVAVRPGDRYRVEAFDGALYVGADPQALPGRHYRELTATRAETLRLKGGMLDSGADVLVISRGPGWK